MARALELAASVRTVTSPNPWVGCVIVAPDGTVVGEGATAPVGGPHAEASALLAAAGRARGGTAYVSLEPCAHTGRTPPCVGALLDAGVSRVVVAVADPDERVSGRGIARLQAAGTTVTLGVLAEEAERLLAPYLVHRRTGRPLVVVKLAATLDGRIAAPDGTSRWITGPEARADVQVLRAESDAILVGAGTVRADDPRLTVRDGSAVRQPLRVVLGRVSPAAAVQPALELSGDPRAVLDELGRRCVLQLLVEGGSRVAHAFHNLGLVDRYVLYFAPALAGGDDSLAMFSGPGAASMAGLWRGRIESVKRLGDDLKVIVLPPAGDQPGRRQDPAQLTGR
jgi:diaminohydroxyphosphoribosylaminopyrimidine deaminase/5-amino-6-(5-phosphoribosylamino)uracil reductase